MSIDTGKDSAQDLIVRTYQLIELFQFARSRELLRSIPVHSLPLHWKELVIALLTFVDVEEAYYTFSYLSPKNQKRDTIGMLQHSVQDELQRVLQPFELHANSNSVPLPRRREAEFFAKLVLDTSQIVKVQITMVTLYRSLCNPQNTIHYIELIKFLDRVERQVNSQVTHPHLENIKTNINTELFILHKLFLAEAQMTIYHHFRETVLNIYQSRADLITWKSNLDRDGGKPSSNMHLKMPLFLWLNDLINAMMSKMTLIFFKPLWRQERLTGLCDMKALVSRIDTPLPLQIENFVQKTDCLLFCLILQAEGLDSYSADGYECPDPLDEEPQMKISGMKSWPVIFSVPYFDDPIALPPSGSLSSSSSSSSTLSNSISSSSINPSLNSLNPSSSPGSLSASSSNSSSSGPAPVSDFSLLLEHLPSIIVLLQDNSEELDLFKPKPLIQTFQRKPPDPGLSYAMFRVSSRVTAVALYKKKIKENDSTDAALTEMRNHLVGHLKNHRIFAKLIPKD